MNQQPPAESLVFTQDLIRRIDAVMKRIVAEFRDIEQRCSTYLETQHNWSSELVLALQKMDALKQACQDVQTLTSCLGHEIAYDSQFDIAAALRDLKLGWVIAVLAASDTCAPGRPDLMPRQGEDVGDAHH